ncbi:hypothetical protein A3F86_04305 [candidate division WOR-1 bacterium RIFCSPLOWO2_12_FULL_45_9]|uniref:histidine kinase n=1 Tax=candidate division WOR-1 bacterium RIFCSPLOWO2_12_FULL_45_9 TaxID=1802568 RepID=A0A1F4RKL4_UNCSA|nr:MAG: hypothetical protein A3F86_04305 [candidate division WOR-1 bacterium RIFCSPLOWO2_12_FULL_45_9]
MVIKRGVLYALLTALISGIFVSLILAGGQLFRGLTGYSSVWVGIAGIFLIAFIFQPLSNIIQNLVDKIFFRESYSYQRIISNFTHALTQPKTDLDYFAHLAPYLLNKFMKLNGASVLVLDRGEHVYTVRAGENQAAELAGYSITEDSPLLKELLSRKQGISLHEANLPGSIAEEMKKLKAVLVIPSITETQYFKRPTLLAIICLGDKISGQSFSVDDKEFLKTFADQATVGIEYAFIFEELKKNQEIVLRSEKLAAIGKTTAGVAHELKGPLTYLSTIAQIMPLKWDDQEFKESVNKMLYPEIQRMQLIIEGLLDYSRNKPLMLKPGDIKDVLDRALALLVFEIRKNKIEVKTTYGHAKKANIDANRLIQVFMNLISNAVQAMGDKGGNLSVTTSDSAEEIKVYIKDTGPGIPKDQIKNIFDPFFSTKESGTGLGLAISKKIIDEHKGSISVSSLPGMGTTFNLSLPVTF